ncbi:MAG: hypothetical protein J5854_03150 [Clostridia bacterium]|nr:hypothetical protein [Clostridia bacterium]
MEEFGYSEEIEKVVNQKATACALYETRECAFLNMEKCGECPLSTMKKEKQEKAKAALSRLMEAAPPEDIESLYNTRLCRLSREEGKTADCFALFDLKKPDPEGNWTIALGRKELEVKGADMILPLQAACSADCRKKYRAFEYLPSVIAIIIVAAGLIVTTMNGVHNALFAVARFMPLLVMLGFALAGVGAYFIAKKLLADSMKRAMIADVCELPEVKKLVEAGFSEVAPKRFGVSRMVFAPSRREHGVYSRASIKPDERFEPAKEPEEEK